MKKINVYRWQNDKGAGPYTGDTDMAVPSLDEHSRSNGHPPAFQDRLGVTQERFRDELTKRFDYKSEVYNRIYFGFTTLRQMNRWFTASEQVEMVNGGFNLYKLEVDEKKVAECGSQCMFYSYNNPIKNSEIIY